MDSETFNQLVRDRRSYFQSEYTGARVPDRIVQQMLENANWAPTHKLTEPWRFKVYTGNSIPHFAQQQAEFYKAFTLADQSYKEERYQNLLTKPLLSSHIIVIGMHRDSKGSVPEVEEVGAVFCAIENMYLTATAYNIGCYLSTGGITYFEGAHAAFGWDSSVRLIGFLHIGKPEKTAKPGQRRPITDKVEWYD
jgi:nitroreductase